MNTLLNLVPRFQHPQRDNCRRTAAVVSTDQATRFWFEQWTNIFIWKCGRWFRGRL